MSNELHILLIHDKEIDLVGVLMIPSPFGQTLTVMGSENKDSIMSLPADLMLTKREQLAGKEPWLSELEKFPSQYDMYCLTLPKGLEAVPLFQEGCSPMHAINRVLNLPFAPILDRDLALQLIGDAEKLVF